MNAARHDGLGSYLTGAHPHAKPPSIMYRLIESTTGVVLWVAAARLALADAELHLEKEDRERVGAMMGTALGGVAHGERQYHSFLTEGPRAVV